MEKLEITKRRRIMKGNWELLPHIHDLIFSKLSISNLPICRLVCKSWNGLVLDYASSSSKLSNILLFSNSNPPRRSLRRSLSRWKTKIHCLDIDKLSSVASLEFDDTDGSDIIFLNSCNGLLFISKHFSCDYCKDFSSSKDSPCECFYDNGIFNPMTGEFFKLNGPVSEDDNFVFGFGFSPKTKQYKLFKANCLESSLTMEIFTIGRGGTNQNHNQWRSLPFALTLSDHGTYFNGVMYWIGTQNENECVIYGLDVETEKIESIVVLEVRSYPRRATIHAFNGTIYAIIHVYPFAPRMDREFPPTHKIQVWRMRGKDLWVKDFIIHDVPNRTGFWLIKAVEDKKILFLLGDVLFCLDKTTGRKTNIKTLTILHGRRVARVCPSGSLNFGSLPNILAGDD